MSWKASTRATTEQIIETHILGPLGNRPVASLTRRDLQAHLDAEAASGNQHRDEQKKGKPLSKSLFSNIRWQLVAIFEMAMADGLVMTNPAAGLVAPRSHLIANKSTATIDDIRRAQMVLGERERLMYRLSAFEGLRPGEIVGLMVGDVTGGVVHIQRRVYRGVVDTPKSNKSRRMVPLTSESAALFDRYFEMFGRCQANSVAFPEREPNKAAQLYERVSPPDPTGIEENRARTLECSDPAPHMGFGVRRG